MTESIPSDDVDGRFTREESFRDNTGFRRDSLLQPLSSPLDEYVYTPLDDVTERIRLCSIVPAPDGAEVAVSLRPVSLADNIDNYKCLSYVWGDTKNTRSAILLNNCRYGIGPNLYSLLGRLRALGITDEVWIDALCINQQDEKEKTEQVKLMGNIYSGAREVLIGLEEAEEDARHPPRDTNVKATIESLAQNLHLSALDAFAAHPNTEFDTTPANPFRQLLKSSYFSRTWVIQEVCLSKEASVLCSWGKVSWQTFVQAFRNWNNHRTSECCSSFAEAFDDELKAACHRVYCAVESLAYTTNNLRQEQHLLELLLTYQHLAVSDDRDKVFAFQGLHTAKGELPPPDYSKTKEEVYTRVAVWMLQDSRSLMLLALDLHEGSDLPSWVPNFSARPPIEPNYWRSRLTFYGTYDCSKGLEWSFEYMAPRTLRLSGTVVDHVQYVSRPTVAFNGPAEHAKLLKEWYAFAGGGITALPCPEALDEIFAETMIAGCTRDDSGIRRAGAKDLAEWKEILFHLIRDATLEHYHTSSRLMACHMTAILNRTLFRTYINWVDFFPRHEQISNLGEHDLEPLTARADCSALGTATGLLGLGPKSLKSSDEVWLLAGSKAPVVLARQHKGNDSRASAQPEYILLGDSYINSIMDGSAVGPLSRIESCDLV